MDYYWLFWVCIIGLCWGSFYNVVILRSLSGESVVFPPSKCPKCNNKLYFWHNIPVLSYILLRGKCYFCKEKISIQYPIIELVTMVLFAGVYLKFELSIKALFVIFWLSCILIMTVTDIKEKLVDCNIAIALGISGIIYMGITGGWKAILISVLGMLAGVIIMEGIARAGYLIVKNRAMGEADTYVAGALGAICGVYIIPKILLVSLISSMIFILPVFFYNKYRNNDKLTCISAILFTLAIVVFYTQWQNFIMLSIIILLGLILTYAILRGIKSEEDVNYLPYVPALAMSSLYYVFYMM